MSVVALSGVSRTHGGDVRALVDVDLAVAEGEFVGIVGPSGSGKSTMLNIMGTLDRPTSGRVTVVGHEVSALSDRQVSALRARCVGFVFQQFHLQSGVTVLDNVADGLLYHGVPLPRRRAAAVAALSEVRLEHRLIHRPHELSAGERQRVAIARAVVGRPALLLADEPTGNLDQVSGAVVMDILRGLHEKGTAVVVITHDQDIARTMPRQVRMRDGQIVADTAAVPA